LQVSFSNSRARLPHHVSSELAEPQKLLPYLLQAEIATLLPEIIAVYIHATSKIFGHWAAEVAQRWDDDDIPEVKAMVDLILGRVREFVSNSDVEVQERVGVIQFVYQRYIISRLYRPQTRSSFSLLFKRT
jgi:AP-3 complex subunit delta-1